eukprot:Hpha_TRINITY_DN4438_c0_g1::TRINITY_DN4438_c0_g1_i1::g.50482::m.50482
MELRGHDLHIAPLFGSIGGVAQGLLADLTAPPAWREQDLVSGRLRGEVGDEVALSDRLHQPKEYRGVPACDYKAIAPPAPRLHRGVGPVPVDDSHSPSFSPRELHRDKSVECLQHERRLQSCGYCHCIGDDAGGVLRRGIIAGIGGVVLVGAGERLELREKALEEYVHSAPLCWGHVDLFALRRAGEPGVKPWPCHRAAHTQLPGHQRYFGGGLRVVHHDVCCLRVTVEVELGRHVTITLRLYRATHHNHPRITGRSEVVATTRAQFQRQRDVGTGPEDNQLPHFACLFVGSHFTEKVYEGDRGVFAACRFVKRLREICVAVPVCAVATPCDCLPVPHKRPLRTPIKGDIEAVEVEQLAHVLDCLVDLHITPASGNRHYLHIRLGKRAHDRHRVVPPRVSVDDHFPPRLPRRHRPISLPLLPV